MAIDPNHGGYPRLIGPKGQAPLKRVGHRRHAWGDLYHFLLKTSWPFFLLILAAAFVSLNALFALAYLEGGNVIAQARPGSFADAFFFSVHTIATLGYGNMWPLGLYANLVAVVEIFLGLLSLTLVTGLAFNKFSRPTARILFSLRAVVAMRDGFPYLMFRLANERSNRIVEAHLSLGMILNEFTAEGQMLRRFYDMKLLRNQTPVFGLSWLAMHPLDETSPLYQKNQEVLQSLEAEIVVNFSGVDDTLMQGVHRQHSYIPEEIVWNAVFEDILILSPDGQRFMDFHRFHQIRPLRPGEAGFVEVQ